MSANEKSPDTAGASRARRRVRAQQVFLECLAATCQVTKAARAAGVTRSTIYDWRASDAGFARAWDAAIERVGHLLEAEAIRRAHEGVLKPVFQGGKQVGTERVFSDTLLLALLRAHGGPRYRERSDIMMTTMSLAELVMASRKVEPLEIELAERIEAKPGNGEVVRGLSRAFDAKVPDVGTCEGASATEQSAPR